MNDHTEIDIELISGDEDIDMRSVEDPVVIQVSGTSDYNELENLPTIDEEEIKGEIGEPYYNLSAESKT